MKTKWKCSRKYPLTKDRESTQTRPDDAKNEPNENSKEQYKTKKGQMRNSDNGQDVQGGISSSSKQLANKVRRKVRKIIKVFFQKRWFYGFINFMTKYDSRGSHAQLRWRQESSTRTPADPRRIPRPGFIKLEFLRFVTDLAEISLQIFEIERFWQKIF